MHKTHADTDSNCPSSLFQDSAFSHVHTGRASWEHVQNAHINGKIAIIIRYIIHYI